MLVSDSSGFFPVTGLEGCQKVAVLLQCLIAEGVGAFLKQEIDHVDDVLVEDIVVRGQSADDQIVLRLHPYEFVELIGWRR